jgi:hypothetical protein
MKTQFKNLINNFTPVFLMFMTMFLFGFGCNTSKPTPEPLAGFHAASKNPDQTIVDDYQNYIQTLSPEEKKYLGPSPVSYFEDETGQHAAVSTIGLNGTWWRHVLIYDKDNKRIKTIKYASGNYRS